MFYWEKKCLVGLVDQLFQPAQSLHKMVKSDMGSAC